MFVELKRGRVCIYVCSGGGRETRDTGGKVSDGAMGGHGVQSRLQVEGLLFDGPFFVTEGK